MEASLKQWLYDPTVGRLVAGLVGLLVIVVVVRALKRGLAGRIHDPELLTEFAASAKTAWRAMVRKYLIEDARTTPMNTLVANDNWLEFTLRYVVDYRRRRATKDDLFSRIMDLVDASVGRVQMASGTFEVVAAPALTVQLKGAQAGMRPPQ
ncbi:MAG: hypothetical protein ABJC74_01200 [Gemmatimonadota bacterium]